MACLIGIDEAGYGPNLGPLVQSAITIRVAEPTADLWKVLRKVARRAADTDDGRLAVDDSKAIYPGPGGFARLEEAVLTVFPHIRAQSLCEWLTSTCVNGSSHDIAGEPWYHPSLTLPVEIDHSCFQELTQRWISELAARNVEILPPCCAITPTPRFNAVLDEHGSKGAVTSRGIISLIAACYERANGEPLNFTIDKLGGRNFYAAMIQTALPDGWVMPIKESAAISEYQVVGLKVPVGITVRPKADSGDMAVALASILSKYLREVLMRQFNDYWLTHVPGLARTAGYPTDATRFFSAIRSACQRLGFEDGAVWRRK